jgi:hypothetical protein
MSVSPQSAQRLSPKWAIDDIVCTLASQVAGCGDLLDVELAALAEVALEALPAPPLVPVLVAVEGLERERPLASLTPPLWHERMFASQADGSAVRASA